MVKKNETKTSKVKKIILFYPEIQKQNQRVPHVFVYLQRTIRHIKNLKLILIDETITPNYEHIIKKHKENLILVGISVMTGTQIKGAIKFSKKVRKWNKKTKIAWGGWHPTLKPNQTLKEPYIDIIIQGQGEQAFKTIIINLVQNKPIKKIYKPNKYEPTEKYGKLNYGILNLKQYTFKNAYSNRCLSYFTSHGCPNNCAFCCVSIIYKHRWYPKKIDTIINDLKNFKKFANIDSVTFEDDNFFVNREHTIKLCKALIKHKLNLKWDTSAHAGQFLKTYNNQDIKLIRKAGCQQIYVGAESGDQQILNLINKKATVEDTYTFIKRMEEHKITPMLSIMICFPNDPEKDLRKTINMIRKTRSISKTIRIRMFFFTPYPGTKLNELAQQQGYEEPNELKKWTNHTLRKYKAPWWTRDYTQEIEELANFYLPLSNPEYYKRSPTELKPIIYVLNKIMQPIAQYRIKTNKLKNTIEAKAFLWLLEKFNRITNSNYCLGFESYIQKEKVL